MTAPPLQTLTLAEAREGFEKGTFTSVDLTQAYLRRISEVDSTFHSVIETNPEALLWAQMSGGMLEDHDSAGLSPYHGIPILLKDNIVTLDCMQATAGSYALVGAEPSKEAELVSALKNMGAVMLGKTNMAEWSGFRSTSGCSGWSARGGQTKGIFLEGSKASGSSTGSAIATALGLGYAALGTETCYSIVSPAEKSGVVGFKPTRDIITSTGIIYASHSQDTVGVLTRTVQDAGILVQEIARWANDPLYRPAKTPNLKEPKPVFDRAYTNLDLLDIRIGIPSSLPEIQNLTGVRKEAFKEAIEVFEGAGAKIVKDVEIRGAKEFMELSTEKKQIVLETEMKMAINTYLSTLRTNPQNIHNLVDLIAFTKSHPREEYSQRNVSVLERAEATDPDAELYKEMLKRDVYFAGEGGIPGALQREKLDVLLMPQLSVTMSTFAAKAGSPALSIPMGIYPEDTPTKHDPGNGMVDVGAGIPFSLYIFGDVEKDEKVLKVAYVFEQLKGKKVRESLKPYLMPTTEIGDVIEIGNGESRISQP